MKPSIFLKKLNASLRGVDLSLLDERFIDKEDLMDGCQKCPRRMKNGN